MISPDIFFLSNRIHGQCLDWKSEWYLIFFLPVIFRISATALYCACVGLWILKFPMSSIWIQYWLHSITSLSLLYRSFLQAHTSISIGLICLNLPYLSTIKCVGILVHQRLSIRVLFIDSTIASSVMSSLVAVWCTTRYFLERGVGIE